MSPRSNQDPTIEASRRRQGSSSGPDSNDRADMPSSGSGGSSRPSGGGRATGMSVGAAVLVMICYGIYSLFFGGDSNKSDNSSNSDQTTAEITQTDEPVAEDPTSTPSKAKPTATQKPQASSSGQTWTILIYQDADDEVLEQDIFIDFNEAERVGSSDHVQIISQFDRYKGAFKGDGNITSTRRYHITKDDDLAHINSEMVQDLGEKNMADGATLADFITWGVKNYPADKYVLILSDHGMGWPGGFSDPAPTSTDPSKAPLTEYMESDQIYMMELDKTLASAVKSSGIEKFEMIGMDACLMSHVEVLSALQPYARYAVLSQETEPALGWAYTSFLQALTDNPEMSGAELGKIIVDSYIRGDQRITDPQARSEYARENGSEKATAAALTKELEREVTLTALDLSAVPDLISSLNALSYAMQSDNQSSIASARTYAPSFTNVFGDGKYSPYIDLGGFVQLLKRQQVTQETASAADEVISSLKSAVIAEKHGTGKRGATGISIYFPSSALYKKPESGPQSYTVIARRFAEISLWDDFLTFHYNKVKFTPDPVEPIIPKSGAAIRAPGFGQIEISPITLSAKTAAPGSPVRMTAKVSGSNIGYIYFFAGYKDKKGASIFKADSDYLDSANNQAINGQYYPQWNGDKPFTLALNWEPTVFQISDGSTSAVALFSPQSYGASAEDAVYTVDGIYHYADGESRSARLYFRDGVMRHVFGYTDANLTGGVREILPTAGDTFTILEHWLDVDTTGQVTQSRTQEGKTLTFGTTPFTWKESYTGVGSYIIGFIVQDMDGNTQQSYTSVTVK